LALTNKQEKVRIAKHLETTIEFLTASTPMGPVLTKSAETMPFYTGADTAKAHETTPHPTSSLGLLPREKAGTLFPLRGERVAAMRRRGHHVLQVVGVSGSFDPASPLKGPCSGPQVGDSGRIHKKQCMRHPWI
jgi:hypothetical protein